jgi:large subunit ribosomal protein L10
LPNREAKTAAIEEIADRLGRSSIAIVTDYRGLSVSELQDLRRKLRVANVEYKIAKNTLTRFAAERLQKGAISEDLYGPSAIAFGYDDPAAAARVVQDFLRTSRVLKVKGGLLGDRRLSPEQVQGLAELPPKPRLQARLVGAIQSPMSSLVGTMNGLLSQIAYVVDQRARQLGGSGTAAE